MKLQKINWKKIEQNVIKARTELNMDSNWIRLENFIEEVITSFNKKKKYSRTYVKKYICMSKGHMS